MIPVVVDLAWLEEHPEALVADVRWYLDGRRGADAYANGHIPGAVFVDVDAVLAGPPSPGGGRHPLPEPEALAEGLSECGIGDGSVVVAYDDAGGANAARLVWLLRMLEVDAAVLDGGLAVWEGPLEVGAVVPTRAHFTPREWDPVLLATIEDAATNPLVIDARAAERYRGELEPVDPRAGHVPGAVNLPFTGNLGPDQRFLPPDELRARFTAVGVHDAADVVCYCGSGVTACHTLVALEHAGLGRGRLYPGSWSQYAGTGRPVATGPEPGHRPASGPTVAIG